MKLHVVSMVSNPVRWKSRYRLAEDFTKRMRATPDVELTLVEVVTGERDPKLDSNLVLHTTSEAWAKESALNVGIRSVFGKDPSAKYVAWLDADVSFVDPYWASETIEQLQTFELVQPWSDCLDLGYHGNVLQHFKSFGHQHQCRKPKQKHPSQPYQYAHTGFAWACTRRFFENVGGLLDFAILGSADHHMAFAAIGEVDDTIHGRMTPAFRRRCKEWQQKALKVTHGEVGFSMGRIEHHFHGPKAKRHYRERWQILVDNGYDPDTDIVYNDDGLVTLLNKPALEQDIRLYNRSRDEDNLG